MIETNNLLLEFPLQLLVGESKNSFPGELMSRAGFLSAGGSGHAEQQQESLGSAATESWAEAAGPGMLTSVTHVCPEVTVLQGAGENCSCA